MLILARGAKTSLRKRKVESARGINVASDERFRLKKTERQKKKGWEGCRIVFATCLIALERRRAGGTRSMESERLGRFEQPRLAKRQQVAPFDPTGSSLMYEDCLRSKRAECPGGTALDEIGDIDELRQTKRFVRIIGATIGQEEQYRSDPILRNNKRSGRLILHANGFSLCTNMRCAFQKEERSRVSKLIGEKGELRQRLYEDAKTLYEGFRRGARESRNGDCLGYRPVDTYGNAGPYRWLRYDEVIRRSEYVARGYVEKGLAVGQSTFVGLYSQNRPEVSLLE